MSRRLFFFPPLRRSQHGIIIKRTLRAEEVAGDVKSLASHDDNPLARNQLLSNGTGQATKKVPLAVDNDLSRENKITIRHHNIQIITADSTSNSNGGFLAFGEDHVQLDRRWTSCSGTGSFA